MLKENGIYQVILNDKLSHFAETQSEFKTKEEIRAFIDKYLFHFFLLDAESTSIKYSVGELVEFDPTHMKNVKIIEYDPKIDLTLQLKSGFEEDICVLRGFLDRFELGYQSSNNENFNCNIFTKEFLKTKSVKIDVIEQKSEFSSFKFNSHVASIIDLKKYVEYIDSFEASLKKNHGKSPPTIKYGVNIESTLIPELYSELERKIPSILKFSSELDALFYARMQIGGVTTPQLYLKVQDAWTGGHEENLRLRSININHGSGSSVWYGVGDKDAERLRKAVLNDFNNFDIYSKEGIWFAPIEYFMKSKIDCTYFVQSPGDIVLVGPGCIHWVKSLNHSVHSSWNFFPKEAQQFKLAAARYKQNKQIQIKNIIPLYTLMLDLLNHELDSLDVDLVEFCRTELKELIDKTNADFESFQASCLSLPDYNHIEIFKEPENEQLIYCEECNDEIFNYWGRCQKCKKKSNRNLCIGCFKRHIKDFQVCNRPQNLCIFYKYSLEDLSIFLQRCRGKLENSSKAIEEIQQALIKESYTKEKLFNQLLNLRASTLKIVDSFCKNISVYDKKRILRFVSNSDSLNINIEDYLKSLVHLDQQTESEYCSIEPHFSSFKFSPTHKPMVNEITIVNSIKNLDISSTQWRSSQPAQVDSSTKFCHLSKLEQIFSAQTCKSKILEEEEIKINCPAVNKDEIKSKISHKNLKENSAKRDLNNAKRILEDLVNPYKTQMLSPINTVDNNILEGLALIERNLKMPAIVKEVKIDDLLRRICSNHKLSPEIVKLVKEVQSKIKLDETN